MLAGSDRVLFGAAYYHEYQPYDRLDVDLDLMQEAHFSVIRVGESVWSTWEPENGQFNLDWLEPVLNGAARRGISVILGTPTYAVPPVAGEPVATEDVLEGLVDEGDVSDVTSLRTVGAARLSPSSSRTRRSWPAIASSWPRICSACSSSTSRPAHYVGLRAGSRKEVPLALQTGNRTP